MMLIAIVLFWFFFACLFLAPLVGGAVLYWIAQKFKTPALAFAGLACALIPETYYVCAPLIANTFVARREAQIASLPRTKLTASHPRTLILRGAGLSGMDMMVLMQARGLDQMLLHYEAEPQTIIRYSATHAPGCEAGIAAALHNGAPYTFFNGDEKCLSTSVEHEDKALEAFVFSNREPRMAILGEVDKGGVHELRLRSRGRDEGLIAYAETPVVYRQISPFCLPIKPCLHPVPQGPSDQLQFLMGGLARD